MKWSHPENWRDLSRAERRAVIERVLDEPCPARKGGTHDDPDNSGICIYCACPIDILEHDLDD